MQLERLVARTRIRLTRGALARLLRSARSKAVSPGEVGPTMPQGSGSWANDWPQEQSAMERAMSLALPDRDRPGAKAVPSRRTEVCGAGIRTRPLMSLREVRLHEWLTDRLEAEAPTCSLHARVAFGAFLTVESAQGASDPLHDLVADMLIIDQTGQPVAVLMRATVGMRPQHPRHLDVLRQADLPVVDVPVRPGLAALWAEIGKVLPAP